MDEYKRHQLYRWGEPYFAYGEPDDLIKIAERTYERPWWWLRLCGWAVKLEMIGPATQMQRDSLDSH